MEIRVKGGGLDERNWEQVAENFSLLVEWEKGSLSFKFRLILTYFCLSHLIEPWSSYICWIWAKTKRFERKKMSFPQTLLLLVISSFEPWESWPVFFKIRDYNHHIFSPYYAWSIELSYMGFPLALNKKPCDFGSYIGS